MNNISEENELLSNILDMLEKHFGEDTEVVLHDLTLPYDRTIVDIRNNTVTGRQIGDCGSNMGLEVLRGTVEDGNRYNYVTCTDSGKVLRTSSLYIKNDSNKVIGSICINTDITETLKMEEHLHRLNRYESKDNSELFANNVGDLLDYLMNMAYLHIGKVPSKMNKEDRLEYLKFLDKKGVFLISKSGEKVRESLGISKFTFYSYLDEIRSDN
ncbi:helix-turn-helix transcriptional regulator [Miniphocaeibacter massiliensis]|uniref:helix-turn-helix transcriptional regulator n=1 Tax=Miniphocaeibacter massiliensis TaxID=2041841 RepID=UPI000C1C421A|nr:helix-turn-helix transcriptional regulator [Miniphocaeibacter massiliensis]